MITSALINYTHEIDKFSEVFFMRWLVFVFMMTAILFSSPHLSPAEPNNNAVPGAPVQAVGINNRIYTVENFVYGAKKVDFRDSAGCGDASKSREFSVFRDDETIWSKLNSNIVRQSRFTAPTGRHMGEPVMPLFELLNEMKSEEPYVELLPCKGTTMVVKADVLRKQSATTFVLVLTPKGNLKFMHYPDNGVPGVLMRNMHGMRLLDKAPVAAEKIPPESAATDEMGHRGSGTGGGDGTGGGGGRARPNH